MKSVLFLHGLLPDTFHKYGYIKLGVPDLDAANVDYSLGPIQYQELLIFPTGNKLLAYGK